MHALCLAKVKTLYANLETLYTTYNYPLVTFGIVTNVADATLGRNQDQNYGDTLKFKTKYEKS